MRPTKHQCQRQLPPHVICAVIKDQFSRGKKVPALTVCNLLLSLIYYPASQGSWRIQTSAKPFPCFYLNTVGLVSLAGTTAGPAAPPPLNPSLLTPHKSSSSGHRWAAMGGTHHLSGVCVHVFIIRAILAGAAQCVEGRKRFACPSVCRPGCWGAQNPLPRIPCFLSTSLVSFQGQSCH